MAITTVAPTLDHGEWAREHFRGFETILMPSFTPDLRELDEDGVRHDVRMSHRHGCFSVFATLGGLSPEERQRYLSIVCEEAAGKLSVGVPVPAATLEAAAEQLDAARAAGCTHALLFPHGLHVDTEDELYRYYRAAIEASDLPIVLWATDGTQFANLHPSNVAVDVYDRLADLPGVIALKLMTTLELPTVFELCERTHERVLIGGVHLGTMPLLVKHYGMQWSGAWTIEALQSPEQPYVVEYLEHMLAGRWADATEAYWRIKPGYDALFKLMAPMLPKGVHPFTHLKYYQWCAGGNGGVMREPWDPGEREFPLRPDERKAIKQAFRAIGIEPREDADECFVVGRASYAKGARAADMPVKPTYAE